MSWLARFIETKKQYSTEKELKDAVVECWKILEHDFSERLVSSTQSRCVQVIQLKRNKIPQ